MASLIIEETASMGLDGTKDILTNARDVLSTSIGLLALIKRDREMSHLFTAIISQIAEMSLDGHSMSGFRLKSFAYNLRLDKVCPDKVAQDIATIIQWIVHSYYIETTCECQIQRHKSRSPFAS